jgi:hypothetical protein
MSQTYQGENGLTGLLQGIEQCESLIRDLAAVILPQAPGFENVWDLTNRVYDRSYSGMSLVSRGRRSTPKRIALSA